MSPRLLRFLKWDLPYVLIIALEIAWVVRACTAKRPDKAATPPSRSPSSMVFDRDAPATTEEMYRALKEHPAAAVIAAGIVLALAVGGIVGLVLLIIVAWYAYKGVPLMGQEPLLGPRWSLWDVVKVGALFPFYEIVTMYALQYLVRAGVLPWTQPLVLGLSSSFVSRTLGVLLILWVVRVERGQEIRQLGLRVTRVLRHLLTAGLAYVAFLPILALVVVVNVLVMRWIEQPLDTSSPIVRAVIRGGAPLVLLFLIGTIAAPVAEELFFRGLMQPVLRRRVGRGLSIAITALLFAAVHMSVYQIFPVFVLGLFFGYVADRKQSVVPSIVLHSVHNTLFLTLIVSTQRLMGAAG